MADPFDLFLAEELAPPPGAADRAFVARVQTRIDLDERLRRREQAIWHRLARELIAVLAMGAALVVLTRAPAVAALGAHSPELLLCGAIGAFAFLLLAMARPAAGGRARRGATARR